MGYSSAEAQLRVIPVYLAATVVSLICAWLTDRYRCRYLVIMLTLLPGIAGFGIMLAYFSFPVYDVTVGTYNYEINNKYQVVGKYHVLVHKQGMLA